MSSTESATKTRILTETMRLMVERRGQEVRISDIARAAGVSRQAVYLHFNNRVDLLVATARFCDEIHGIDERLIPVTTAASGVETLCALIEFWGNYIPLIYGLARALLDLRATDEAAASAWADRMEVTHEGCRRTAEFLQHDGTLRSELGSGEAGDLLWSLLDLGVWENLTIECGWSTDQYIKGIQSLALHGLVQEGRGPANQ